MSGICKRRRRYNCIFLMGIQRQILVTESVIPNAVDYLNKKG
jgi:hypothetical protein